MPKELTIAVTMATSRQGMAVVRHLSKVGTIRIRAMTRDISSSRALGLSNLPNVELIRGDLLQPKTLLEAFKGVHGIFGNTTPTRTWGIAESYEFNQGKILIDVVKDTFKEGALKHFIFSSICKGKCSSSKTKAPAHFQTKWDIENYIHQNNLSNVTTILRPASYFENFNTKIPGITISDRFFPGIVQPNIPWQTIAVDDIGLWVSAAFRNPEKFLGTSLNLACEEMTGHQMANTLQAITNKKAVSYLLIPRPLLNFIEHDIAIMANWIEKTGYGANIKYLRNLANELRIKPTPLSIWLKTIKTNSYIKDNNLATTPHL